MNDNDLLKQPIRLNQQTQNQQDQEKGNENKAKRVVAYLNNTWGNFLPDEQLSESNDLRRVLFDPNYTNTFSPFNDLLEERKATPQKALEYQKTPTDNGVKQNVDWTSFDEVQKCESEDYVQYPDGKYANLSQIVEGGTNGKNHNPPQYGNKRRKTIYANLFANPIIPNQRKTSHEL